MRDILSTLSGVKAYKGMMGEGSRVYDGDTIQNVYIEVTRFPGAELGALTGAPTEPEELFPGILLKNMVLYKVIDIRLAGIDTPERRPRRRGRTLSSIMREKAAAALAKKALEDIIADHSKEFIVDRLQMGKYSGRVIANVTFVSRHSIIEASSYMIQNGHATAYDGGTRPRFDDWYTRDSQ